MPLKVLTATIVAQVVIVLTGGLVRITGAGLGCPDWPQCTGGSLVPGDRDVLAWIEFSNRIVALGVAALCFTSLLLLIWHRARPTVVSLALAQLAGVLGQGVLGGISVLVELHPIVVAAHFVLSGLLIYLAVAVRLAADQAGVMRRGPVRVRRAADAVLTVALTVVVTGTLVTAAGPYSGDAEAARLAVDDAVVGRVHAAAAASALVVTVLAARRFARMGVPERVRSALVVVFGLLVVQAGIGTLQVLTDRPPVAVAAHLLVAACVVAAVSVVHRGTRFIPVERSVTA